MNLEKRLKSLKINDTAQLRNLYDDFPNDKEAITEYVEKLLKNATSELDAKINDISVKIQLAENAELLPLAYIAKRYFNKTKSWLYQRVNGNIVNGNPAKFTEPEKVIFNNAIRDISKKIGSINIS